MAHSHYPLEPPSSELRGLANQAIDLLLDRIERLPEQPASRNQLGDELLAELSQPPPETPQGLDSLLDRFQRATDVSYETAGPSYLAYIPGGGVFTAAVAELLALGTNRYTGKVAPAPACVALENSILRWMCELFDFPETAQGLLTTGGSLSNLTALVAARTRHAPDQSDRATVYVGEHAHGSLMKAARIAGISPRHVRTVRSTPDLRMDLEHLEELIASDRRAGLIPVCISAAAGTTNTGTIDLLPEIAAVARDRGIWFHIDGAYGGFFRMTERGRDRLRGIELADSIALDPHKSLFLPFGTGALVVRDADDLRRAFAEDADYMQDLGDPGALPDFDNLGPELTREFRGLRVWLPLHLHGVAAFRDQLDEKLDLAQTVYTTLARDERITIPWTPDLTVIAFRLAGRSNDTQLELLRKINNSQKVLLSSTRIEGEVYIRIAILSFRTHHGRIDELLSIISRAIDEVG